MHEKNRKGVMALLFTGVLMGALDISIVGPTIPEIEKTLHTDPQYIGWVFSIYVLFHIFGISLFAKLSDNYGRRRIYILALAVFLIGSAIVSFSNSFEMLLIGRSVQGFGASGILPIASAVIGDLYPVKKRGRLLGLIGAVFGIAFLTGPFIAGVVLKYFEWTALFLINIPVCLVLIWFSNKILPDERKENPEKIDAAGILILGFSLGAFVFAVNTIDLAQFGFYENSVSYSLIFVSAILMIILYFVEKRSESPVVDLNYFSNVNFIITGFIALVTGFAQSCFVFIPKYSVEAFSVTSSAASFMLTPLVLATAVGAPVFGRLIDRYGVKLILILGLIFTGTGFFALAYSADSKMIFYSGGILLGLGFSIISGSSLRYIILNETKAEDRAVSQGILTIFISVGQLIGAALIGLFTGGVLNKSFQFVFLLSGFILITALIVSGFLRVKLSSSKQ